MLTYGRIFFKFTKGILLKPMNDCFYFSSKTPSKKKPSQGGLSGAKKELLF